LRVGVAQLAAASIAMALIVLVKFMSVIPRKSIATGEVP
jgi:hypothetical protein